MSYLYGCLLDGCKTDSTRLVLESMSKKDFGSIYLLSRIDGLSARTWPLATSHPLIPVHAHKIYDMECHCTAYRDSVKVALFVRQVAEVLASLPLVVVPSTLYRGTCLHRPTRDQPLKRRMAFFTASRDEGIFVCKIQSQSSLYSRFYWTEGSWHDFRSGLINAGWHR